MIIRNNPKQHKSPIISITSTTYQIVEWLKENFGGGITRQKTYQDHHKPAYCWKVRSLTEVFDILEHTLPHMLEPSKIARGNLILDQYLAVTKRNGKYSPDELARKLDFERRFASL